jgi:hypothetical protein
MGIFQGSVFRQPAYDTIGTSSLYIFPVGKQEGVFFPATYNISLLK